MTKQPPVIAAFDPHTPVARRELILGGQRSGKSRRAEMLAEAWLGVTNAVDESGRPARCAIFVATATAHDDEMQARIRQHQADRAARLPGMQTLEEPTALATIIRQHSQPHRLLLVDCLTLWLANQYPLDAGFTQSSAATDLLHAIETAKGPLVFVSNEIGLGVVPMGREVRAYVDALGWLNQQVAARCDRVCLMAAGLPLMLKDEPAPTLHVAPSHHDKHPS
ncbi:MAG: bifunctional adenosylcobinamide kinase/adenosylcobinamide-phosphate guanylyltransferase [Lautropia sp.]|nr:bifunctional adenosylcobinamide kinase/adenosylcobinamide-phosphate guanylyltransferase [Lautropia sp.]